MNRLIPQNRVEWIALGSPLALAALFAVTGCTTLGTNVKGSFSCSAPDGTCAPATAIDDSALAAIDQQSTNEQLSPAGPYRYDDGDGARDVTAVAPASAPVSLGAAGQGRMLRIVFPAYVDRFGRLHEKTAVQAVVDQRAWNRAFAARGASPARSQALAISGPGLFDAAEAAPALFADASAARPRISPGAPAGATVPASGSADVAGGEGGVALSATGAGPGAGAAPRIPAEPSAIGAIRAEVEQRLAGERVRRQAASFPGAPE